MTIFNGSEHLPGHAVAAFSRPPNRVVLPPGSRLYRLASVVSPTFKGSDVFGSPWWFPSETYHALSKTATRTKTTVTSVARAGLAIAVPWNPMMEWLSIVELRQPVYAWIGPTRPQPLDGMDRSVMLRGQLDQAFVPGLAKPGSVSSDAAVLVYYGNPPEI